MSRVAIRVIVVVASLAWSASPVLAEPITFDAFDDSTVLGDLIPGLTFSNATVGTAGVSFNEQELPPKSGANVIFDSGGPMRIDFAGPIVSFAAYFTYFVPLTLQAFDASGVLLGSMVSAFASNSALFGDAGSAPNELLSLAFAGTAYVTIDGDLGGGSFVLDDLSFEPGAPDLEPIPEPSTLILIGTGAAVLLRKRFTRRVGRT